VTAVAEATGVSRSTLQAKPSTVRRRGRPPLPEGELLAEIRAVIAELPTEAVQMLIGFFVLLSLFTRQMSAFTTGTCRSGPSFRSASSPAR
jgi:hypothetical protein